MFKSVISGLIAVSVLATPVVAEARGRGDHRVEQNHRRHGGHLSTGEAIAIGVGAVILGAAINSGRNSRYEEPYYENRGYDREVYRGYETRRCYDYRVPIYDRYGRFVYNEVYTRCN